MRRIFFSAIAASALVASAGPARAQAWPVEHQWSDKARPNDPTSGSFAWEYGSASIAIAGSMTLGGEKYDCSKFAMTVLSRYAQRNGLEVVFRAAYPGNGWRTGEVSSSDPQFHSFEDWETFYKSWINAKTVATENTSAIDYSTWRSGDLVLLSWKQLGANDPFLDDDGNPRDVWHTYFVGEPGKLLFYGNESGDEPLPIAASSEQFRLDEAQGLGDTGGAVYEAAPRRWNIFKDAMVPPDRDLEKVPSPLAPERATVLARVLNVRSLPSLSGKILARAREGFTFRVEGETKGWLRVRLEDGTVAYVKRSGVHLETVAPAYPIAGGSRPDNRFGQPSTTNGIDGAIPGAP